MSMRRQIIGWLAGSLLPPLGAIQLLSQQGKLLDPAAWLVVLGILVTSTTAVTINFLTQLNADAGNPPIVVPPKPPEGTNDVPSQ